MKYLIGRPIEGKDIGNRTVFDVLDCKVLLGDDVLSIDGIKNLMNGYAWRYASKQYSVCPPIVIVYDLGDILYIDAKVMNAIIAAVVSLNITTDKLEAKYHTEDDIIVFTNKTTSPHTVVTMTHYKENPIPAKDGKWPPIFEIRRHDFALLLDFPGFVEIAPEFRHMLLP